MQRLTLVFVTLLSLVALGHSLCEFRQELVNLTDYCAVVNVTISLDYTYTDIEGSEKKGTRNIECQNGVLKTEADDCNSPIVMSFEVEEDVMITFQFIKSNNEWDFSNVSIMIINPEEFFNGTLYGPDYIAAYAEKSIITKVGLKKSYMCSASQSFDLKSNSSNISSMTLKLSDLRAQAFEFDKNGNDLEFGSATRCNADIKGSKIVPIAVGAALAGLVIIVLIAYIIGRIRSRKQSSYEALS
ncbi:PREDICTED: lysosome-associated membrane glycoprotein 1-like [Amphimedon queenslandica]|uniref:Lysosome-associated membrane glycoprotein 2-like transmembrane domain-containing protein n=1 Tax=Amphimedon queenslandica TaxID=400682 RepID=A0A1X7VPB1_AMPQE|nr:PREDICTED: lysosome-associated membrane glycoprotein 1-like [Amphimedon queenslandica]|eukprot:XP_003383154.1 PREDICTED: lysosome-associated membrane glycoprotein 1-like [Amphimedon queenslandica]